MSKSTTKRRKNGNNNQVLETKLVEQKENEENVLAEQLDFEIDCPRCGDVMELFSEFDHLSYYCDSCRLELDFH